jgi:hypothetical protein
VRRRGDHAGKGDDERRRNEPVFHWQLSSLCGRELVQLAFRVGDTEVDGAAIPRERFSRVSLHLTQTRAAEKGGIKGCADSQRSASIPSSGRPFVK